MQGTANWECSVNKSLQQCGNWKAVACLCSPLGDLGLVLTPWNWVWVDTPVSQKSRREMRRLWLKQVVKNVAVLELGLLLPGCISALLWSQQSLADVLRQPHAPCQRACSVTVQFTLSPINLFAVFILFFTTSLLNFSTHSLALEGFPKPVGLCSFRQARHNPLSQHLHKLWRDARAGKCRGRRQRRNCHLGRGKLGAIFPQSRLRLRESHVVT